MLTATKFKINQKTINELYESWYASSSPLRFGQYFVNNTVNFKDQNLSQKIFYSKASPSDIKATLELYIFDDLI